MKRQQTKAVRGMKVERKPSDKATRAIIIVDVYDNGMWRINGDPCSDDLTANRCVAECLESLGDARDRRAR